MTRRIAIAAGGTGGHLFPALALARELLARGAEPVLMTDSRGAALPADLSAITVHRIRGGGVASGSALGRVKGLLNLGLGVFQAAAIMTRIKPDAVAGFGGYPSIPPVLAAARAGIPTVVHEQNAVLGRANRLLAPFARTIATCFDPVAKVAPRHLHKVRRTGNPVRPEIAAIGGQGYTAPQSGPLYLLVFGGSLGASVFAQVVPAALEMLPEELRTRLRVVQQARENEIEGVISAYRRMGVAAEVRRFFDDMPARLATAHLVLCRSGASTVAELACAGRPAILVPYPHAVDDHQAANARALETAGGAWVVPQAELSADRLSKLVASLAARPDALTAASSKALMLAAPDAAAHLAELVMALPRRNGASMPATSAQEAAA